MKRILIPLCIVVGSHVAYGQRSYQFDAPDRLFVEGKELFSLKNYAGCIDKLEAYKQHSTNADLIQEADYMLVYAAYEQGRPNADELLKDYLEEYPASRHSDEIGYMIGSVHFELLCRLHRLRDGELQQCSDRVFPSEREPEIPRAVAILHRTDLFYPEQIRKGGERR